MFDHALFDAGTSGSGTFPRRLGWMALAYLLEAMTAPHCRIAGGARSYGR